jgi:hypothetical protein
VSESEREGVLRAMEWKAYLVLFGERVETSSKLSGPFAIARQVGRSDLSMATAILSESFVLGTMDRTTHLAASVMPQVAPIHLEPTMIKGVDHLVYDGILHMSLAEEPILTEEDPMVRRETT